MGRRASGLNIAITAGMGPRGFTVGVEEEYQLVNPKTGELESCAYAVLAADWSGEIRKELQESTVETGTRVCASSSEVRSEIARLRLQAATAAASEELEIVAAGLHPFSRWERQRLAGGERYARMAATYGRVARDEHNFGMHIHVAVTEGDRIALLNRVRAFIPHLLALACSSPFFEGEDTLYASYRMILWRRWPGSGIPPRFESADEYRRYVDALLRAGAIGDERNLYWSIRVHHEYPTLEFRMYDVCPLLEDAVAIAGLTRCLVAAAAEGRIEEPIACGLSRPACDEMLADDCWRAARYGLDARFVDPASADGWIDAGDSVLRLLHTVLPVAEALGELDAVEGIERIVREGTAAERMRRVVADGGDLRELVRWLGAETLIGVGMTPPSDACEFAPVAARGSA